MMAIFRADRGEMKAYPEEIESEAEHREVPKEHAAVETRKALNKWHRGWNLAAEFCHKPKDVSWRKLSATCRGTTHRAKVAWCKRNVIGKNRTGDVVRGTWKRQMFGRRHQPKLERKNGTRNQGLRQQLRSKWKFTKTFKKTTGLEIVKQIARSTVGLRKIKDWTLWRGWPPPIALLA
jgi:hypothetical protein